MSSYKILENNNYTIELIEVIPCDSKKELHQREGAHIRNTTNCVNINVAGRTGAEYYMDNKETIKIKLKTYKANNKEKFSEYEKQYREQNKEKYKQYYEQNKEKIVEYKKNTTNKTNKKLLNKTNKR
jgi:hypothetical protein